MAREKYEVVTFHQSWLSVLKLTLLFAMYSSSLVDALAALDFAFGLFSVEIW